MADLVAFLRARLDDDQRAAEAASPAPWSPNAESDEVVAEDGETVCEGFALSSRQLRATVKHIARHDPVRVLADIATKRGILDLHADHAAAYPDECAHCNRNEAARDTIRLLAQPYRDHPDFDPAWTEET